ncbi:hypothetical protein FH972_019491 [Carpinus fangiana]|uniref:Uncharacterized protein n=1 Tax=Carpinus fangiana TaxID=176857 RepID=A0A5N6RTU3_9ROSI|nr:hypothetical protein FH972_019491 [Carpinus fangiana]
MNLPEDEEEAFGENWICVTPSLSVEKWRGYVEKREKFWVWHNDTVGLGVLLRKQILGMELQVIEGAGAESHNGVETATAPSIVNLEFLGNNFPIVYLILITIALVANIIRL